MAKKSPAPHEADPRIKYDDAIECYGTQSKLARALNLERASVNAWKKDEFIPPLHAHRLLKMKPGHFKPLVKKNKAA